MSMFDFFTLLLISLLLIAPISRLIVIFRTRTVDFLPTSRFYNQNLVLYKNSEWSGFLILVLSSCIWAYFNLFNVREVLFVSPFRALITYLLVTSTVLLSLHFTRKPDDRPLWSPANWSLVVVPVSILLLIAIGVWGVIEIVSAPPERIGGFKSFFLIIGFLISLFLVIKIFATIAIAIFIAQFNFSISNLVLSILFSIYQFIDTGSFNYLAYFEHVFGTVGDLKGIIPQIISMLFNVSFLIFKIIENRDFFSIVSESS